MKRFFFLLLFSPLCLLAQKKPLDHSVYDGWQSIGERMISNDGKWVVYTVTMQEGDANLYIQSTDGSSFKKQISRGSNAVITEDSRYVVFRIRPPFKETREARIKKRSPADMPKDSIGIIELGKDNVFKTARIKSYKTPEKGFGWVAYQKEASASRPPAAPSLKTVDSLKKTIDSLTFLVAQLKNMKAGSGDGLDAEVDPIPGVPTVESSELVLRNLIDATERVFKNVVDYSFNAYGQKLVMRVARAARDSSSANGVLLYDLKKSKLDTILKNGNDFKNFAFNEDGSKLAFVAERDTNTRALQKFYDLYLYRDGSDSATIIINKHSVGMDVGMTVSENGNISFSKSGNRLLFGTTPIQPPKDTSLIEIDLVKLDIWNYKDDYLQSQQLFQLNNDLRRSYLALFDFNEGRMQQLGSPYFPYIIQTNQGDGNIFIAVTDTGRRVQRQWGDNKSDIYAVDVLTGEKTLVKRNHEGGVYPSSTGKYILLYDNKVKHYFVWDARPDETVGRGKSLKNISSKIKVPLYDEEHDSPSEPGPYGLMGWHEGDSALYVYDRYDVWKVDPMGIKNPETILSKALPRQKKITYRYVRTDPEERFISNGKELLFRAFNNNNKETGFAIAAAGNSNIVLNSGFYKTSFGQPIKAKNSSKLLYTKETFQISPVLYFNDGLKWNQETKLSAINPQQSQYNWGTAELYHWKAFDGKPATGILYKPEDFDSTKKYPMIIYFYEKVSDALYNYIAPAPTPSRLNIPFFVSRGYLVFTPDISYKKGKPGESAYNYIVSGAQALSKKKWVDAKNIGIQGQSWGGYQVAFLITRTNMFKAAWAGAPVVNMFSAYGGIRWESGVNRQFQYEKTQSRIGATPWERPDLYIANSPFFHLTKVKTPLVIMANDADGAVPWYQGIEFFTAMRRLNKPVWMLNYNGEAHNLVERKNRKDIQIREQQFFDWLLKGGKPAKWIVEGVPAVKKGKDWGLELVESAVSAGTDNNQ